MFEVGDASTGNPQDVEEILRTLREAGEAVGKGAAGVVAMFHAAPSTVLFDYLSPGVTTLDELRETAANLADHATAVTFAYPKVTVRVLSEDVAFSMAYSQVQATLEDGSLMSVNSRVTNVWQRIDGAWRAVHEHSSVPVDVSTATADLTHPI